MIIKDEGIDVNDLPELTNCKNLPVQPCGLNVLLDLSSCISSLREFHIRTGTKNGQPLLKLIQEYPGVPEEEQDSGFVRYDTLRNLYGEYADNVIDSLVSRKYCRHVDDSRCVLTWKFRRTVPEDFTVKEAGVSDMDIYRRLDAPLWRPFPHGEQADLCMKIMSGTIPDMFCTIHEIGEKEYWFRQGIFIRAFRFHQPPSPELIQLIAMKLEALQLRDMQNFFHVTASYNSDVSIWTAEKNRSWKFFDIIKQILKLGGRLFDLSSFEVSIEAAGEEKLIANGYICLQFSEDGRSSCHFNRQQIYFETDNKTEKEFAVNNLSLHAGGMFGNTARLSLKMVSRTSGNVNPRSNTLANQFIKNLIELTGKLISVIMPILQMEKILRDLKWRSFLDALRLRSLGQGENLHKILVSSLRLLHRFIGVSHVSIFSENSDLRRMLGLFRRDDLDQFTYVLLREPILPADILARQIFVFPIHSVHGRRVIVYFNLPVTDFRPENPDNPNEYLKGTELWKVAREEALLLGIEDMKDFLFFFITECLADNPRVILKNLDERLRFYGRPEIRGNLMKLGLRLVERFGRVLDLFRTFNENIASGLAYMRGRRDNLTGLYNRQHFSTLLKESFDVPGGKTGLMFIDMDNFKIFNDTVSHSFGDKMLIALASRMMDVSVVLDLDGVSGRFGGDEFCFFARGLDRGEFEKQMVQVFKIIARKSLRVGFFFEERPDGKRLEINFIAFMHRLMRPDVGNRQAASIEFAAPVQGTPREYVMAVWQHMKKHNNLSVSGSTVHASVVIDDIAGMIEDKILSNNICSQIDAQFHRLIHLFVELQFRNFNTDEIRDTLIQEVGAEEVARTMTLKISAGIAHSSENRIRSVDSLFKIADSRAYLAKNNGRNCLFGLNGEQLV